MFICTNCGQQTRSGEPATKVVLKTRERIYPERPWANRYVPSKGTWPADPGGKGTEIVEEGSFCPRCAAAAATGEGGLTHEPQSSSRTSTP